MMATDRRSMMAGILGLAASAFATAAGLLAGHGLMRSRPSGWPAKAPQYPAQGIRLIRPPGAVDEEAFLAGCIRCYRCQDACEPGAIQFFTETAGSHYHTPYVDPSILGCNVCMKCTQVCPTGVIEPLEVEQKREVAMGSVELNKDRCLSYKAKRIRDEQALLVMMGDSPTESEAVVERRGPCGECFMFCPVRRKAIDLVPGAFLAPIVFPEHCIGCGMCEEICRQIVRGEPAIRVVATRGEVG
jgi:ferredoxin-type protein NapG